MAMNFGASDLVQVGAAAYMYPADYRRRLADGNSPMQATAGSWGNAFTTAALSLPTSLILPLLPTAVKGLINAGIKSGIETRKKAMPFSQRYEHSDMAGQMQGYALSRMGEMTGFGNEASQMFGRYGRG
jgi:hypothetical protein